ncbi:hypothetical protein JTB14_012742 [Gonioctena quinquepunctata]|nr:hypothetical protein JTB14_012742 [Gonioctena quinquepunctata]
MKWLKRTDGTFTAIEDGTNPEGISLDAGSQAHSITETAAQLSKLDRTTVDILVLFLGLVTQTQNKIPNDKGSAVRKRIDCTSRPWIGVGMDTCRKDVNYAVRNPVPFSPQTLVQCMIVVGSKRCMIGVSWPLLGRISAVHVLMTA